MGPALSPLRGREVYERRSAEARQEMCVNPIPAKTGPIATWAVICLIRPAKVRSWAMRMTERPAAIRVLRPSQDWARRYVRRPIYIWHTRFVGICALLMAIAIAYAGMLKVL